ncbi:hypothetical protein WMY93_022759 [Mugilogobius chulae]|uniref:Uncharacterized protein n=1 Tax=Mugilogobius chulae TaxID=88201 RepID=A0AAW0NHY0_9GOBI
MFQLHLYIRTNYLTTHRASLTKPGNPNARRHGSAGTHNDSESESAPALYGRVCPAAYFLERAALRCRGYLIRSNSQESDGEDQTDTQTQGLCYRDVDTAQCG